MKIRINAEIHNKIPDLFVKIQFVENVKVQPVSSSMQARIDQLFNSWDGKTKDDLNSMPVIAAYRHLQERLGLNPKQFVPTVEGLILRGIIQLKYPRINSTVDSANLVSLENLVPIGLFDSDKIEGDAELTLSKEGEEFLPLGKDKPEKLRSGIPILKDSKKIFSAVGIRDSKDTSITSSTKNLLLFSWGTKEIEESKVQRTLENAASLIRETSK